MRTLRIALALLLIAPLSLNAQAITVAVFPLTGNNMTDPKNSEALGAALREMVISELANNPKLRTIDRGAIDDLLKSRNLSLSGKLTNAQEVELGQLLGAQYSVGGQLTVAGNDARMDLHLTEMETGLITAPEKLRAPKDQLLNIVEKVTGTFVSNMKVKTRVADVVVPIPSQFAYSRGLDYEQRGDKKKAAEFFQSAIKIFPDNAAAKAALDRVQ